MNLRIHEGNKSEDLFLKDVNIPDPSSTDNAEFNIVENIIKHKLEGGDTDKWKKMVYMCMGFSEDTFMGVHQLDHPNMCCILNFLQG